MELRIILYIFWANAIGSFGYALVLIIKQEKTKGFLMLVFSLLCPVIALSFLFLSWLYRKLFFLKKIEMNDISFRNEKNQVIESPNFVKEINVVSIEEALIISDKQDKRRVILDALKEDINKSITMIANALDDEDSETSHYVASVLADVKSDFKVTIHQMSEKRKEFPDDVEIMILMLNYINGFIEKKVLSEIEEETYIDQFEQLMNHIYELNKEAITGTLYRQIITHLLSAKKGSEATTWAERAIVQLPKDLNVYKGNLKLYYEIGDKDKFFEILSQMKKTNMDYDSECIDIMHFYQ